MKVFKTLLYSACILGAFACSNDPEEEPLVEKTARIEFEFEGSLDQYLVNFGLHSLYTGQSGFVSANQSFSPVTWNGPQINRSGQYL